MAASWPETISEAIRRPLFAVLLGVALAQGREVPRSRAQLVATLAEGALGTARTELEPMLRPLAVESLHRGGGPVPLAEVTSPDRLNELLSTRLVVSRDKALVFPLIIFAQWFAGAALAEGDVSVDALLAAHASLDDWLYPLALCAARYPHETVTRLLAPLARNNPGFAASVVEEALATWGIAEVAAPPSLDAARRVRAATEVWVEGVGDLAEFIAPLRLDGRLAALGARAEGPRLTLVWYRGQEDRGDVFELPATIGLFGSGGPAWGPGRMASPGAQSAWAWRWALEGLTAPLSRLLKSRRLPVRDTPLFAPALYELVARINNHGSLTSADFDVSATQAIVTPDLDFLVTQGGGMVPVTGLHADLQALLDDDEPVLPCPFPGPDRERGGGGWIWEPYGPERLLERTVAVFSIALEGYQAVVRRWFSHLAPRMLTAVTLPAVLRGAVRPATGSSFEQGPLIHWYLDPLPTGEESRVELELAEDNVWARTPDPAVEQRLRARRPEVAKWAYSVAHSSVLDVFHVHDAAELVYAWLWSDLRRTRWVSGNLGGRSFSYEALEIR